MTQLLPDVGLSHRVRHVVRARSTSLSGWHWGLGAVLIAVFVLPVIGVVVSTPVGWPVLGALLVAFAGARWRVVVHERGFSYAVTLWGLPVYYRRLPANARFAVDEAQNGSAHVWLSDPARDEEDDYLFGTTENAAAVCQAMREAVARHHLRPDEAAAG